MDMRKCISVLFAVFILFLSACDKVSAPYIDIAPIANDTVVKVRKVLIEDFTGHKCPNCPRASEAIKVIQQVRPGRIIAMGIHVTSQFAAPGSGIYNIDFRTAAGNSLDSLFGISTLGLPAGMVNRKLVNVGRRIDFTMWSLYVDTILQKTADAFITIDNNYNAANRTVNVGIQTEFLQSLNGNYKLNIYVLEDSIPHAQKDNVLQSPSNDSNYVHDHVLRASVNGLYGVLVSSGSVAASTIFTKNFTTILNAAWREKHCSIVAILYDAATMEVIQAEQKMVIQ